MRAFILINLICLVNTTLCLAQWSNRYPKVDGYGHHVYLEGYELPVLNSGITDPSPSPKDNTLVFSSKGWLWILNLNSMQAQRITFSSNLDFRPNWSPNGEQVVFVRDNGHDTKIVLLDLTTKEETTLVDTKALDLDPIFSHDGEFVYYASAENGSIDIWRINVVTLEKNKVTEKGSLERLPVPLKGDEIIYLKKEGFSYDSIEYLNLTNGNPVPLAQDNFASQTAFAISPDNRTLAYVWPHEDKYELRLLDIKRPSISLLLSSSDGLPLTPKFDAKGDWIYFSENNREEYSELKRIRVTGGPTEKLAISSWEWDAPVGKLKIISKVDGIKKPVRMSITNRDGHPIIPENGIVHSEGQNGIVFFYSPGEIEVTAPFGELIITTVHGFSTKKTIQNVMVNKEKTETEINLERIWDANSMGWYSGDNHFHLNYGGTTRLDPEDIILDLNAEDLDVAFPLLANLHNRFLEQYLWGWKNDDGPIVRFGQEIRSHFLGHLALLGTEDLYWPWIWGPSYDVYGLDDRLNAEALRFAGQQDALGGYVHPVSIRDPFTKEGAGRVPIELVADCVLGEVDLLELGCLWTDEIGTAAVWHNILNIGVPLSITAGSDVMNDLYRTMAIGSARVYVKPEQPLTVESYLEALKKGRSFVSTGPQIEFEVDGKQVGDVISTKGNRVKWTLKVHSPVSYDKVEIFINGKVVWSKIPNNKSANLTFEGFTEVPVGGWITARVSGGNTEWPVMNSYPFAESSPIWFNKVGSIDPLIAQQSAQRLLDVLLVSEEDLKDGYGDHPIPKLLDHFDKARQKLLNIIKIDDD